MTNTIFCLRTEIAYNGNFNLCVLIRSIAAALVLVLPLNVIAQKTEHRTRPNLEMLTCNVRVLDPDGNPIEDATVWPTGLRARKNPNKFIRIWGENYGPVPKRKTDADGLVEMFYPKYLTDEHEVGVVSWNVTHPDFVDFRGDRSVDDRPANVKMKRGFRVAVTAVSPSGERITQNLYAVISGHAHAEWSVKNNGMLVSPVFAKSQGTMRVVQLTQGQPTLFSKMIDVSPGEGSRVLFQDVELRLGTRVEGRLADTVPRPVKNGYVGAYIVRSGADPDDWNAQWTWAAHAPIAEDGTFIFPSLPTGEVVQLTPMCDGWVPDQATKASVLKFYPTQLRNLQIAVTPQLFELTAKTIEPTLNMNRGAGCRITVTDSEGNPIRNATVFCGPYKMWFEGGNALLSATYSRRERLELARAGRTKEFKFDMTRFKSITDENGVAVLEHLPTITQLQFFVEHDEYEVPSADDSASAVSRAQYVLLENGKLAQCTVQLQKKATQQRVLAGPGKPADSAGKNN